MKAFALSLIILLLFSSNIHAQSDQNTAWNLSGQFADSKSGAPLSDVVIQLMRSSDSTWIKTEISDQKGTFQFTGIESGQYFIYATLLGYTAYKGNIFVVSDHTSLPLVKLESEVRQLGEIVVEYKKSFIERDRGKVTMNVESSINAEGSSAFELLEKAPGVTVNAADNISYKGHQGVIIQLDGKEIPMSTADLANYLRAIPSTAIDKIEFISNPSAKFDSEGNSIINIRLKKDRRMGTNGSITDSYGQGVYHKINSGVMLNHRGKKTNLFGSYNFSNRKGFNSLVLDRDFYNADTLTGSYVQDNYLIFPLRSHTARAGADFYIDKKNTLGLVFNGASTRYDPEGENVSDVFDHNNQKSSLFRTSNRSHDHWYNYSGNINYKHNFDTTGTELVTDIDYAYYGNNTEQNFTTRYFNLEGTEYLPAYLLDGDIDGALDIYSIKTDLVKTLRNGIRMESGVKASYVKADNNLAFYNLSGGLPVFDSTKSNHFIYRENINAVYTTFSKEIGKWNVQLGLRSEYTGIKGEQLVNDTRFDTSYIQLFPSGFLGYKFNDKHSLELSYSRRINRPNYDQLNPFKFFLDPSTYKEGNPYLKPQTTHAFELTHVFRQKFYTTLSWGRTINNLTEVLAPSATQANTTVQTFVNLGYVDVYSLSLNVPLNLTSWWTMNSNLAGYYALYNGTVAGTTINNTGKPTFNLNMVNNFNLSNTLSAEISGNYQAREVYAYNDINPIWFVSAGIQKKFLNNRAILKFNVTDIGFTNKATANVSYNNYKEHFKVQRDTRVATLSFTYKFGNANAGSGNRREGSADDIKQRAGDNG